MSFSNKKSTSHRWLFVHFLFTSFSLCFECVCVCGRDLLSEACNLWNEREKSFSKITTCALVQILMLKMALKREVGEDLKKFTGKSLLGFANRILLLQFVDYPFFYCKIFYIGNKHC